MAYRVYAVVLAAGSSTRFDGKKLLQDLCGKPLLHYSLSAAQEGLPGNVVLVAGHDARGIIKCGKNLADIVAVNSDYSSGQGTSVATGVSACREFADAVIILLADQPFVTADTLARLIEAWSGTDDRIVVSDYGETQAPPVLFGRGTFDRLCALAGDQGAKSLLRSGAFDVVKVAPGSPGIDIDTPEDLARASQTLSAEK